MLVDGMLLYFFFVLALIVWNSCVNQCWSGRYFLVCHSFMCVSFKNVSFKYVLFKSCVIVAFICVIGDSGNEIECVTCWLECLWWPSMVGVLTDILKNGELAGPATGTAGNRPGLGGRGSGAEFLQPKRGIYLYFFNCVY